MLRKPAKMSKRMGARPDSAEQPHQSGPSLSASEVVTVVRRLGFVLLKAHEVMQGNLVSHGQYELAERLNDSLKPLADMLAHFELSTDFEQEPEGKEVDGV